MTENVRNYTYYRLVARCWTLVLGLLTNVLQVETTLEVEVVSGFEMHQSSLLVWTCDGGSSGEKWRFSLGEG